MPDGNAATRGGAMSELAANLRGRLIQPSDDAYEAARKVYNGDISRKPLGIAQCTDVADVIRCVNAARDQRLAVAVRGGGHSVPGFGVCDNGLVIDLCR